MKQIQRIAIVAVTGNGIELARRLCGGFSRQEGLEVEIVASKEAPDLLRVKSVSGFMRDEFDLWDAFIFIGALGICIRAIAPVIRDKRSDPAVLNCDEKGLFVQSVLSGHRGGANRLTLLVARLLGAQPVVTTSSDVQGLWPLDVLGEEAGWDVEPLGSHSMTFMMADFVNRCRTALLLEVRDAVTDRLERTKPDFIDIFYNYQAIHLADYRLLLAVTPRTFVPPLPAIFYRPKVLCVGLGSERAIDPEGFVTSFGSELASLGFSPMSVHSIGSIDIKGDEPAFLELARQLRVPFTGFSREALAAVADVPNPSETVMEKIGVASVSEASSALLAGRPSWLSAKRKCSIPGVSSGPRHYTFAVSLLSGAARQSRIAIVGAGPGDPELITLRGRRFLETADLVLYAGSLVPEKLTHAAKPGALVRSSAGMALEEQLELMHRFYREGKFVVRLHTGDPSIYGAIQEQMAYFEEHDMQYEIVPGVSSFQAAAAALHSEFTVPDTVQTIILTRGSGRTPVPEKERLRELARSRSTMCIYLSGAIAEEVQKELLEHYPGDTPVAVCYRLSQDDQEIFRGSLSMLAELVRQSGRNRTLLLVVGEAIGARKSRSKLYDSAFAHGFRGGAATGRSRS